MACVFLSVYGAVLGAVRSKGKDSKIAQLTISLNEQSSLPNQLEEAQLAINDLQVQFETTLFEMASDYLGHLSNDHLEFNDTERISLYMHDDSQFELVGRYSKNVDFSRVGRPKFPDNEGCIGQTWQAGGRYFVELPDADTEYYRFLKEELNLDKGVARSLRMPSKAYCSFALENGYTRIGIVMFESTRKGFLDENYIHGLVQEHKSYLIEVLKRSRVAIDQSRTRTEGD